MSVKLICLHFLQVPVIVCDQPLYALCKQIQWLDPEKYGEDKMFVLMGALHIEMASMRVLGDWLDGSGWASAIAKSNITTTGRAEALLTVSHLTRSRYAHQVKIKIINKKKSYLSNALIIFFTIFPFFI